MDCTPYAESWPTLCRVRIPKCYVWWFCHPQLTPPSISIVFVHGLQGHPRKTWEYKHAAPKSDLSCGFLPFPHAHKPSKPLTDRMDDDDAQAENVAGTDSELRDVFWPLDLLP